MNLIGQNRAWTLVEHGERHRRNGPTNQDESRRRRVTIDGTHHECYRGDPRIQLQNGQYRSGTRVSIKIDGTWWHITQSDQPKQNGERPNLYESMGDANKVYEFM